ncbi:MAG: hypothetical protein L6V88_03865 [Anaerotruncus sp.]|nr:MAG: hypothetical protein L6V88_03865 [Anaerotruncus sp.]
MYFSSSKYAIQTDFTVSGTTGLSSFILCGAAEQPQSSKETLKNKRKNTFFSYLTLSFKFVKKYIEYQKGVFINGIQARKLRKN